MRVRRFSRVSSALWEGAHLICLCIRSKRSGRGGWDDRGAKERKRAEGKMKGGII
jgi:hypothetical protein